VIWNRALEILGFHLPFYFRYVDNIAMAVPSNSIDNILNILNIFDSFCLRLQFILEIGGKKLNFLDVTMIIKNNFIEFDWYHKPTFSGKYLNFLSEHSLSPKRGTIINMLIGRFFSHIQNFTMTIYGRLSTYYSTTIALSNSFLTPLRIRLKYLVFYHSQQKIVKILKTL